jgi:signal recognition particle receptor subunit beta
MMTKMEHEINCQEENIKQIILDKKRQAHTETQAAEHLLKNVKGSFRVQKEKLDVDQERLIKEIQSILKNDELQWTQIKTQVKYRLHTLQSFDQIKDYAEAFIEIADMVEREERERHSDDQEIINMLNEICIKMYHKISDDKH